MLHNVWPEVLKYLLARVKLSQKQFAEVAGISQKALSRYATGKNRVGKNFGAIAKAAGLTKAQLGYVHTRFMMQHYRAFRFPIGAEEASEIRETATTYDPTPRERAETLMRLDIREVPVDLAPPLTLMRKELRAALEQREAASAELDRHLLRLVEHCEQMFHAAIDVAKKLKSLGGS